MLNISELLGFNVGGDNPPVTAAYAGGVISGANNPPYAATIDFATYTGDWVLVVASAGNSAPSSWTPPTINGVSTTELYHSGTIALFLGAHPGAGSYSVSSSNGGGNNGSVSVYAVTGTPNWVWVDIDENEATNLINCPKDGFILLFGRDSSGSADTATVAGINVVDASSGYGGDSASFLTGHINNDATNFPTLGETNISYAMSSSGTRVAFSFR